MPDRLAQNPTLRGYILVALAAGLWGTLGLFFRSLHDEYGLSSLTIAFLRAGLAAVILLVFMVSTRRDMLKVSRRALVFYAVYGLIGVAAFYFTYVQAVVQTTVTTAVVLLYTAPAFVTLFAWRLWNEPLTRRKLGALAMAFAGCALVARAYDLGEVRLNALGLIFGLGAGLTYALYTIFSKSVMKWQPPSTALTFALVFGTLFLAPLQTPASLAPLAQGIMPWLLLMGLAVGPTLGSLSLYNAGLRLVPASNASLVANLEPVVAFGLALTFRGERLEALQLLGAIMVIGGAAWLALDRG